MEGGLPEPVGCFLDGVDLLVGAGLWSQQYRATVSCKSFTCFYTVVNRINGRVCSFYLACHWQGLGGLLSVVKPETVVAAQLFSASLTDKTGKTKHACVNCLTSKCLRLIRCLSPGVFYNLCGLISLLLNWLYTCVVVCTWLFILFKIKFIILYLLVCLPLTLRHSSVRAGLVEAPATNIRMTITSHFQFLVELQVNRPEGLGNNFAL